MKTYLVFSVDYVSGSGSTIEDIKKYNEEHCFKLLRALSIDMPNKLVISKELMTTGVAVVEATDEAAQMLKEQGYIVEESQKKSIQ